MAYREKSLSAEISPGAYVSASLGSSAGMSGELSKAESIIEKNYEKLSNKPQINGVELIGDKSLDDLNVHEMDSLDVIGIWNRIFNA